MTKNEFDISYLYAYFFRIITHSQEEERKQKGQNPLALLPVEERDGSVSIMVAPRPHPPEKR